MRKTRFRSERMKKPCHIVFTTIHHPAILRDLYENIHRHGHLEEVKVWVVGDRKTPVQRRCPCRGDFRAGPGDRLF